MERTKQIIEGYERFVLGFTLFNPTYLTWNDIMHEIYVRQAIEAGLNDSKACRTTFAEHVREKFGLPK